MGKAARESRRVSQRAHEATFGVFCPGMLETLSIGRGRRALLLIGTDCTRTTNQRWRCTEEPGRRPDAYYGDERWCDGCIAREGLT